MVIFTFQFVRVKMGGKIQTSLKLRSWRNTSQKMSLRVKQIGFSIKFIICNKCELLHMYLTYLIHGQLA